MANTVETQTIVDGSRNLVVKVHIHGDGTGDESETLLIDASSYTPAATSLKLMEVKSNFVGFTAELIWDATTNVHAWQMPDYEQRQEFWQVGGIPSNVGAGETGDVLITTSNLGNGDSGTALLFFKKRDVT